MREQRGRRIAFTGKIDKVFDISNRCTNCGEAILERENQLCSVCSVEDMRDSEQRV